MNSRTPHLLAPPRSHPLPPGEGKVSEDVRFAGFFAANPDCLALVKDLESIADAAKSLFEPVGDPSDKVWSNIASKLKQGNGAQGED